MPSLPIDLLGKIELHQVKGSAVPVQEFLVSTSGQMSIPAPVQHRWGLDNGGPVAVFDLGDAVVVVPADTGQRILREALSAEEHRIFVARSDDPDLATT
jgi:bifunctional DNA-binding transcriptional regulator/antitoxin component of YhaV-PrlF toxin-antitoxin module